jgi:uncharacterized protein involved in exopolysaccharide biosynthesis
MAHLSRRSRSGQRADLSQQFWRYARAVWRRKMMVLVLMPLAAVVAAGVALYRGALRPKLEARVVMGLESPGRWGALDEYSDIGAYRVEMIRSRRFLADVVGTLSLRLMVEGFDRGELFDSVSVDSTAISGVYRLDVEERGEEAGSYAIYYTNPARGYRDKLITTSNLTMRYVLLPGVMLWLSERFVAEPRDFRFRVIPLDEAVESIVTNLSVEPPTRQEPDHFRVSLAGRDYELVAATLNAIAGGFVDRNTTLRKRRTRERLKILETQLQSAEAQLRESEAALRHFLSENPSVSLEGRIAAMVGNIAGIQTEREGISRDLRDINRLAAEFKDAGEETLHQVVGEMLAFLDGKEVPLAQILRVELSALLTSRAEMERNYMEGHPLIEENTRRIRAVGRRAHSALLELRADLRQRYHHKDEKLNSLSSNLQNLPAQTLRLAELQRDQQINSEIYASLQNRYSEAKVADAVNMADVFIIDRAVEPVPPPLPLRLARVGAIVLFAGLGAGLVPVFFLEHLNRTALTEFEAGRITDLPVVESIPVIKPSKQPRAARRSDVKAY